MLLRIGLASAGALLLQTSLSLLGSVPAIRVPFGAFVLVGSGAFGLLLFAASALRKPAIWLSWLILVAFLIAFLANVWVSVQSPGSADRPNQFSELVQTDSAVYTDMAATLLLKGRNPYSWDYSGAMALYRSDLNSSTPTTRGIDEALYPYPALPFLLTAAFQLIHLPGIFGVLVVGNMAMLGVLFFAAPKALRPVILIPTSVGFAFNFTALTLVGVMDNVWAGLLLTMMILWRRPGWRAILFGLAIAFKQVPWFLAPFLLMRIWHEAQEGDRRLRDVIYFTALSVGTFLLVNSPFIIMTPVAWLQGVTEPVRDSLVLLSQGGLSSLTQYGIVYLPKTFYLIAVIVVLALLLFCYWRHESVLRNVIWLFPAIVLWVSYRAIVTYWVYWLIPMLGTLNYSPRPTPERPTRWQVTAAVAACTVAALTLFAVVSASPATIEVDIQTPVLVSGAGTINTVDARITNKSQRVLTPRFMVQSNRTTWNSVPWQIDSGPTTLQPGQSADYQVSAGLNDAAWTLYDTSQLVVVDAGENSALRGVATLPADPALLWPDAIPNAAYQFWTDDRSSPIFWAVQSFPAGSGGASIEKQAGRDALALAVDPKGSGLGVTSVAVQTIFPARAFGVWLYADSALANSPLAAYGIELDDSQHVVRYQIGALNDTPSSASTQNYQRLNLPPDQWSYVEIDPSAVYTQQGWQLPTLQQSFRDLNSAVRPLTIRFFAAAGSNQGPITAYFGPIQQADYGPAPETLMAETLNNPAEYYVRLGDMYLQQRNDRRAVEAYQQALGYSYSADIAAKLQRTQQGR